MSNQKDKSNVPKNEKLVLLFSEIQASDLALVGGKGANLGELTRAGYPVPPGFCLTTRAFDSFLSSYSKVDELYDLLDSLGPNDLEKLWEVGKEIRESLLGVPVPEEVVEGLHEALEEIGCEYSFAVRSSATAEDLPEASFAGQQDTYLNVKGEKAIVEAVRKCWVSLFTDRAIQYRIKNKFSHRDVKLSVVIQKMVMAKKSGILFTAHPITGHRHTLTIDASFGLGEAIVSGVVTPDSYAVDKRSREIIKRMIGDKRVAVLSTEEGGTYMEELGEEEHQRVVLTDDEIMELTDLGCKIEAHYGFPQDIEWAIANGQVFILQARPITSLYPIEGLAYPPGTLGVFFSLGHQQSMTKAMSPLGLSTIKILLPVGRSKQTMESRYVRSSGNRLFADITLLLRHRVMKKGVYNFIAQLNALAPEAIKEVIKRPEFKRSPRLRVAFPVYKGVISNIWRINYAVWRKDLTGFIDKTNQIIDDYLHDVNDQFSSQPLGKERVTRSIELLSNLVSFIFDVWLPEMISGMMAIGLLQKWGERWLSREELEHLISGIPGNVVNEMNMMIGDLADIVRGSPKLVAAFSELENDAKGWLKRIEQMEESKEFLEAWNKFLSLYGARSSAEIDIASPRWHEDPLPVLLVIKEFLHREKRYHRKQQEMLVKKRKIAMAKLVREAGKGPLGGVRVRTYKRLYQTMLAVGGMREHHKFTFIRVLATIKEHVKELAVVLVKEKKLEDPEDVWFLTWSELLTIWDAKNKDWGEIIAKRKEELKYHEKLTPPLVITSDGETPVVHFSVKGAPEGALVGNPVSPGVVEGVVHVIHDPTRETLSPGEILVAEFTDPGWTPLFINAKALILEVGGALTHGAVVAREYGIPAIVGVQNATRKLEMGQRVRVDGNRGIIELLE